MRTALRRIFIAAVFLSVPIAGCVVTTGSNPAATPAGATATNPATPVATTPANTNPVATSTAAATGGQIDRKFINVTRMREHGVRPQASATAPVATTTATTTASATTTAVPVTTTGAPPPPDGTSCPQPLKWNGTSCMYELPPGGRPPLPCPSGQVWKNNKCE